MQQSERPNDALPVQNQLEKAKIDILSPIPPNLQITKERAIELMDAKDFTALRALLYDMFSCASTLSDLFSESNADSTSILNIPAFLDWYHKVDSFDNTAIFISAVEKLLEVMETDLVTPEPKINISLLIVLYLPILQQAELCLIIPPKLCRIFARLESKQRFEFAFTVQESIQACSKTSSERQGYFKTVVQVLQQYLTLKLLNQEAGDPVSNSVIEAVQTLAIFSAINDTNNFVPFEDFYNETVEEQLDLKDDFPKWKSQEGFSFCNYPFLFSTVSKGDILRIDGIIQMRHELQDSFFRAMFIGVNNPYLQIEVRRTHVVRDTLFQLQGKSHHDLKKQLRVAFVGEDGIDEGGIQKEFFQIIAREIFSPTSGLFTENPESRTTWFSVWGDAIDKDIIEEYELLGKLLGLAFYNGVSLDLNFTPALYKKILHVPIELSDLTKYDPSLGLGLSKLLEYKGDIASDYQRSFEIELATPTGSLVNVELVANGRDIPLTAANRDEYVSAYVDTIFNTTVSKQFNAFLNGLNSVMNDSVLKLFRPEELNELICGSASLDFKVLESSTVYDGYEPDTPIIKYFWEIVHEFTDEQKKQFLVFTTGSDRVPIGGLSKLQFVIARNGTDSDRLPTSHTCFNALLLSEYSSKEKLKDRILVALANRNCGFYLN